MNYDLIRIVSLALNKTKAKISDIPDWSKIISTAKQHGITAALYVGLTYNNPKDKDIVLKIRNRYYSELKFDLIQQNTINCIQSSFENNGIYSIALKGSNTKRRYPQTVLRSMGDIDILIKPSQNSIVKSIMTSLGFASFSEGRKHDHYNKQK